MLTFPRSVVRALRSVGRKCVAGRPRGPAPPTILIPEVDALTWVTHFEDVVLAYRMPGAHPKSPPVVLPRDVLDSLDGPGEDLVTLDRPETGPAELRWADRGGPRSQRAPLARPDKPHGVPERPDSFAPMTAEFLSALHEAGRTTSRQPSRFAVHRVQLKGGSGDVIVAENWSTLVSNSGPPARG